MHRLETLACGFQVLNGKVLPAGADCVDAPASCEVARRFVGMVPITSKEAASTWSIDVLRRHPTFDPHDAARVKIVDFVLRA